MKRLLFLGTGGSMGVPVIGCQCAVCTSSSLYNKRTRPGALLKLDGKHILIDAGPDFRVQALTHKIDALDGVIFTHAHHDHTAGIDDLRIYPLKNHTPISCLLSKDTADDLYRRYDYIFRKDTNVKNVITKLDIHVLEGARGETEFLGHLFKYFTYEQAKMAVNGFRLGNFAFVTDIKYYPETIFEDLKGVKTLVVSALRHTPSPFHLSVDEAIDFSHRVGAEETWFTHIAHELDHEKTNAYLPKGFALAYDGLEIVIKE